MIRSAIEIIYDNETCLFHLGDKITCRVVGEMSDGSKVWEMDGSDEQYLLHRINGKYFFAHI